MKRRQWIAALLLSLAIHGLLLWWLSRTATTPSLSRPIELTLVEPKAEPPTTRPPSPPPPHPTVPTPTRPSTRTSPPAHASREPSSPATHGESPSATPQTPTSPPADAPRNFSVGQKGFTGAEPAPGGTLIVNHGQDDDPNVIRERQREAQAHAESQVQEWAQADVGRARVRDGAIDGYFVDMKHALEDAAQHAPPFSSPSFINDIANNWKNAAAEYGRGGQPMNNEPEDPELRAEVRRNAPPLIPGSNTERIALGVGQTTLIRQESAERVGVGVVALVEVYQDTSGRLVEVKLKRTSGSKTFDDYAIKTVPDAVAKLPPPKKTVVEVQKHGIHTLWAYRGEMTYRKPLKEFKAKDAPYLASMGLLSMLGGSFDETTGKVEIADLREPRFSCKVELLAVY